MKTCNKCNATKPLSDFYKNKKMSDGVYNDCKECHGLRRKQWYQANRDKHLNNMANWREENKEHVISYQRAYNAQHREHTVVQLRQHRANNPELVSEQSKRYYYTNKDVYRQNSARRRLTTKKAIPVWADSEKMKQIYERARQLTEETGIVHEVDHIVPLNSKFVCGLHCHTNLQVIPATDNRRKGNKLLVNIEY